MSDEFPFPSSPPSIAPLINNQHTTPFHLNQAQLMELIEATLNKKRSALESAAGGAKKKYIRRGDLERQREQEYYAEQERVRKEKEVCFPHQFTPKSLALFP
jgi:hypothetical protein